MTGGLKGAQEVAKKFAANVKEAASRYADTDQTLGQKLGQQQFGPNGQGQSGGAPGTGSAGGSGMGGMDQMGQMMQMPMQMAGQALQAPMQMAGMLGSLPQGLMQGVQMFSGMAGQAGHTGQLADANGTADGPSADHPQSDHAPDNQDKRDDPAEQQHKGAAPQREKLEPVPDSLVDGATGGKPADPSGPPVTPAPSRPVTSPPEIL